MIGSKQNSSRLILTGLSFISVAVRPMKLGFFYSFLPECLVPTILIIVLITAIRLAGLGFQDRWELGQQQ